MNTKKLNFEEFCDNLLQKFFDKEGVNQRLLSLRNDIDLEKSESYPLLLTGDEGKLTSYYLEHKTHRIGFMSCTWESSGNGSKKDNLNVSYDYVTKDSFSFTFNGEKSFINDLPIVRHYQLKTNLKHYSQFTKARDEKGNFCFLHDKPVLALNTLPKDGFTASEFVDNKGFMDYLLNSTKDAIKPFLRLLYSYYVSTYCSSIEEIHILLTILSRRFQSPDKPTPALCFVGAQGSGKSTLSDVIRAIVGSGLYFKTSNKSWLTDNFTSYQLKPYCCIEECQNYSKSEMNMIKDKVTDDHQKYNEKFEKAKEVIMQQHFMFTSNFTQDAFYFEGDDRRFFVLRTEKNSEFADVKKECLVDITLKRVFMFLMLCDTSMWNEKEALGFSSTELMTIPKMELIRKSDGATNDVLTFFECWRDKIEESGVIYTKYDKDAFSKYVPTEETALNVGLTFGIGNLNIFIRDINLKSAFSANNLISKIHHSLIDSKIKESNKSSNGRDAKQKIKPDYVYENGGFHVYDSNKGYGNFLCLSWAELDKIIRLLYEGSVIVK